MYVTFYQPEAIKPVAGSGHTVEIKMIARENQWVWDPSTVTAKVGDKVIIRIFNEDNYDHGWALEAFAINRRLFPKQETAVEFIAAKTGTFQFYCSVPCGDGHYGQVGTLIVEE